MSDPVAFALAVIVAAILFGATHTPTMMNRKRKVVTMAGKRYGGGSAQSQRLPDPIPFEVEGLRFDTEEVHEFVSIRKVDTLLAARFMNLPESEHGRVLRIIIQLIGKTLDNQDGTPIQWTPAQLPKPKNAGENYEPKFRGPDGKLHPMDQVAKFTDPNAGSSRRRWEALVNDEDFTVEVEVLGSIARDLIGASAGRPTDG